MFNFYPNTEHVSSRYTYKVDTYTYQIDTYTYQIDSCTYQVDTYTHQVGRSSKLLADPLQEDRSSSANQPSRARVKILST